MTFVVELENGHRLVAISRRGDAGVAAPWRVGDVAAIVTTPGDMGTGMIVGNETEWRRRDEGEKFSQTHV